MTLNVGSVDRMLRIVVGLALIALAATGSVGVWGYLGLALVLTGLVRTCPAYLLLGVSTCGMKKGS